MLHANMRESGNRTDKTMTNDEVNEYKLQECDWMNDEERSEAFSFCERRIIYGYMIISEGLTLAFFIQSLISHFDSLLYLSSGWGFMFSTMFILHVVFTIDEKIRRRKKMREREKKLYNRSFMLHSSKNLFLDWQLILLSTQLLLHSALRFV